MSDTVEQIKSRLDIADVISGYLKVQKAGANYKARCPFHNEKTPSFYISPERQSWHCFGCNKGGDMFSFVQEIEGIQFVEAMRILAGKAGVQLPQWRPEQTRERDVRASLLAVTELSAKFFTKQLWHSNAGAKALEYLRGRGLKDETIVAWRLGWAPNDWRALTTFLQAEGHRPSDVVSAGMGIDKNDRLYDRFRSRIMFPIADSNGQVVGFTGRVFGAEVAVDGEPLAKYVNTPQTSIYDKSKVLFGLDKAKLDIRRKDSCLLVEGNMDALMAWQAGAANVVATSGTALTSQQLRALSRYSTNLSFCFDADQAGQAATRRGIGLALSQNLAVNILTIADPDCKDPADYVAKHGEKFNEIVASAKPALQYYYDRAVGAYDPASAQSKKAVLASLGPLINRLTSNVERSHWVGQVSVLLRASQDDIRADLATIRDDIAVHERMESEEKRDEHREKVGNAFDVHNESFLGIVAARPELVEYAQSRDLELLDPRVAFLVRNPELLRPGADHEYKQIVDVAYMRAQQLWQDWDSEQLKAELARLEVRIRIRGLREQNVRLALDIQRAEAVQDREKRDELLRQFQQNNQQMHHLQMSST